MQTLLSIVYQTNTSTIYNMFPPTIGNVPLWSSRLDSHQYATLYSYYSGDARFLRPSAYSIFATTRYYIVSLTNPYLILYVTTHNHM